MRGTEGGGGGGGGGRGGHEHIPLRRMHIETHIADFTL